LNVKKARNLFKKKRKKIESLDSDLDWTWTTICIYKQQDIKNMNGKKSTYFSPLIMLKISRAFQTIKNVNQNIVVKLKHKYH
jgi:hypothetical protein